MSADPERLLSVLDSDGSDVPPEIEHVYKRAFHNLKRPLAEASSYLEMTARQSQLTRLADHITQLPLIWDWKVPWASWLPLTTHRILVANAGSLNAMVVAQRRGRTVIVSGGGDHSIRIWDLELGQKVANHSLAIQLG